MHGCIGMTLGDGQSMMLFHIESAVKKYTATTAGSNPVSQAGVPINISALLCTLIATLAIAIVGMANPAFAEESGCGDTTGTDCESTGVTSAPSPSQPDATVGNPINLITGNKYQRVPDYQAGNSYLSWTRHYNSGNADYNIGLGYGWTHDFAATLIAQSPTRMDIVQGNGRRLRFHRSIPSEAAQAASTGPAATTAMNRVFIAATPTDGYITRLDNGDRIWTLPDHRELRFRGPLLVRIDFKGPAFLTLHYSNKHKARQQSASTGPRLSHIRDHHGREIALHYVPAGNAQEAENHPPPLTEYAGAGLLKPSWHLSHITLPDSTSIQYHYDQRGNLIRSLYPGGEQQQYAYDNAYHPHLMTAATITPGPDVGGGIAALPQRSVWQYDEIGRATSSAQIVQTTGGTSEKIHQVQLSYETLESPTLSVDGANKSSSPDNANRTTADALESARTMHANVVTGSTTITNSLNHVSRYEWQRYPASGHSVLIRAQGPGCFSCPPTGVSYEYTEKLQVKSIVAETGRTDQFEYDTLGRRTRHLATVSTDTGSETLLDTTTSYREVADVGVAQPSESSAEYQTQFEVDTQTSPAPTADTKSENPLNAGATEVTHSFASINPNGRTRERLQYNSDGQLLSRLRTGFSPTLPTNIGTPTDSADQSPGTATAKHFVPISEETLWHYDSSGRLIAIDPAGHGSSNRYSLGYQQQPEFQSNAPHKMSYNVSTLQLPLSGSVQLGAHSAHGYPQQLTDPDGTIWSLRYDRLGQITTAISQTDARKQYFNSGRLVQQHDADGQTTGLEYDSAGRLTRVQNAAGDSHTLAWNSESQLTDLNHYGSQNEWLSTISFTYSQDGKVSSSVKRQMNFSSNQLVSNRLMYKHDRYGFVEHTLQPVTGRKVKTRYHANGSLLALSWPVSNSDAVTEASLRYRYDVHNQLAAIEDPAGKATWWQRDDFGRPVVAYSPDTGRTVFTYDEAGNPLTETDAAGNTKHYAYDAENRVTDLAYNEGTLHIIYNPTISLPTTSPALHRGTSPDCA